MEPNQGFGGTLWMIFLFALFASGSGENDRDFKMCGTWRHGNGLLTLAHDLKRGCGTITISANESSLSIRGEITAQCENSSVIKLDPSPEARERPFCVYWEPLLDQLWVEVNGQNHTLCWPSGLQGNCCTDLSQGENKGISTYGILNATQRDDIISYKTHPAYEFFGEIINCKNEFCDEASQGSGDKVNMIEETVMRSKVLGNVVLPCALSSVVEMEEGFQGYNITLPAPQGVPPQMIPSVHLPSCLKPPEKKKVKVVCTYFKNSILFQGSSKADQNDIRILEDVVGITVENEIITNLPEPIRIGFHHSAIPTSHSRKCVSWDTKKDPAEVTWKKEGCETIQKGVEDTECHCNHLTYFAILVQLEPRPVRHLAALTVITSMGCAASTLSCVVLIYFLNTQRRAKDQSTAVHRGLAMALFLLSLLFFLTGTVANVGGNKACWVFGAALHYALLSSFSWMFIEVLHTFWLVYMVFSPSPNPYVWHLVGFGLPAVPVIVLLAIGKVYGVIEVVSSEDVNNPYLMCWMDVSPHSVGLLAHYFINLTFLAVVVLSGLIMLFLVLRNIQNRDEWRKNKVAFLSIWGLSCLFGTTWGLGFLDFGQLSEFIPFLFCILNSLQGFFLMLRFYILERMRKQSGSSLDGSTASSTRQHMLQEKS
ncbi:adhesion G-protein coupled receptor G5-like [Oncorhynchus kisutch]|uniref:Adhesion G protein-coupled receptor G1 n=1 Tax=Oncorhynchus kisutch TaxID=8019 RepID=A0A8C7DTX8_ONCKI|nr:adhesion G-protein coupled receptor G5-like [Oncorhynchus kisutch]